VLTTGLSALQADVIAFQEVIFTPDYDQVRDVVAAEMQVVHHSDREPGADGVRPVRASRSRADGRSPRSGRSTST